MFRAAQDGSKVISKQTEVDFGTTPVSSKTFTVADDEVTVYSRIFAQVAYEAPTGKDLDEVELDLIILICAPGDKVITIHAKALEGYVADKFKINYLIG